MQGKGFGFVTFSSPESVNHILLNREVHQINGKFIDCKKKQNVADAAANNMVIQQGPQLMQQPPNYGPARLQTRPQVVGPYQAVLGQQLNPGFLQKPRGPALDGVINATEIFAGGLPAEITEEILLGYFSPWGEVTKIDLKHGKGYAFISFSSPETVENICMNAGSHEIGGKIIDCKKRVLDAHQQARQTGGFQQMSMGFIQQGQNVMQEQAIPQQNQFAKLPNPEPGQVCGNKIFAGGLPRGTREEHLMEVFGAFGSIQRIDMKNEKGFAFIHFDDPNVVPNVLKESIAIGDQWVECKQADNRPSKMQVYGGGLQ